MEIIVEGKGTNFFTANQVILNLNFITKGSTYEDVLDSGSKSVEIFVNKILEKNKFTSSDMKTRNFVVREETKYNEITRKYETDGYSYNQNAVLKFDYDNKKMAKIMGEIAKLDNPPFYQINFGIKDEKECRREILKDAYIDALNQAKAIADAAGLKLNQCVKVDFKPFTTSYISQTSFSSDMMYAKSMNVNASNAISKTFTPEDIELTETLYCLWVTE